MPGVAREDPAATGGVVRVLALTHVVVVDLLNVAHPLSNIRVILQELASRALVASLFVLEGNHLSVPLYIVDELFKCSSYLC